MIRGVVKHKIMDILARYDFAGLMDIPGIPYDEYSPEADCITDFVMNNINKLTIDELADNVQLTFINYFCKLVDVQDCQAVAHEIIEYLK